MDRLAWTPVDFDEFSKGSGIGYQSIHNYVGKKRLAIYPRYMTAVAFTAYTKYRAQQMEEIAKYDDMLQMLEKYFNDPVNGNR